MRRMMRKKRMDLLVLLILSVLAGTDIYSIAQDLPPQVISFPDLVLVNGKVLTADDKFTIAEAVAIRDGKFLAVGSNTLIRQMAGPQTKVMDAQGKTVIPGIINTHFHLTDYAERDPLYYWKNVDEMLATVKQRVATTPEGHWIVLWYMSTYRVHYEGKVNKTLLDSVDPKHPVAIGQHTGSIPYVNSLALEKVQWPPEETDGLNRDTGVLSGRSSRYLVNVVGWMDPMEDQILRQKEWINYMIQLGTTAIHTRVTPWGLTALRQIWADKELKVRFRVAFSGIRGGESFFQSIGNLTGMGDNMLRISGIAPGAADGFIGIGKAWTFQPKSQLGPWKGDLPTGSTEAAWAESREALLLGTKYGWNVVGVHSEGDRATAEVLADYEKARATRLVRSRDQTLRIDHQSIVRPDEIQKMKELGIVPAVVTWHAWSTIPNLVKMYGTERVGMMVKGKSYLDAGLKPGVELSFGCPFWSMQKMVTREDGGVVYGPSERVSREEALKMHTNYAAAYFDEQDRLGTIEPGKLADLAVVDGDYMKVPENQIEKLPVSMTMLGGEIVFETARPEACKNELAEKSGGGMVF